MCGMSDAKIDGMDLDIFLGFSGGRLDIGEDMYGGNNDKDMEMLADRLSEFSREELVSIIVQFVKNSEEG